MPNNNNNHVEKIPLVLLAVLIVIANLTVCALVCISSKMRTYTNGFVVSLAMSDILMGGVLLPTALALSNSPVLGYLCSVTLLSGVFNICAVTYDRYIAVMRPFRYQSIMRKRFRAIIVASWSLALTISLLPLFWDSDTQKIIHKTYVFCEEIICVLVPHVFIFAGHYQVFKEVRKCVRRERKLTSTLRNSEQRRMSSEAKVAKVFIVIAVTFALSWLPVEYMTTVYELGRPDLIPTSLRIISLFTIGLGSLVNPVVYSFMKPDFRHAVRKILKGMSPVGNSESFRRKKDGGTLTGRIIQRETTV